MWQQETISCQIGLLISIGSFTFALKVRTEIHTKLNRQRQHSIFVSKRRNKEIYNQQNLFGNWKPYFEACKQVQGRCK